MADLVKGCLDSCGVSAEKAGEVVGSLVEGQVKKCMGGSDNNIMGGKKEDKEEKEEKEGGGGGGGGGGMDAVMNFGKSLF